MDPVFGQGVTPHQPGPTCTSPPEPVHPSNVSLTLNPRPEHSLPGPSHTSAKFTWKLQYALMTRLPKVVTKFSRSLKRLLTPRPMFTVMEIQSSPSMGI